MWARATSESPRFIELVNSNLAVRKKVGRNSTVCLVTKSVGIVAGEFEGSDNVFFHDSRSPTERNLISAKRCFRARGTHALETRRRGLSVSPYRGSTM